MTTKNVKTKAKKKALVKGDENTKTTPQPASGMRHIEFKRADDMDLAVANAVFVARPSVNAAAVIGKFAGKDLVGSNYDNGAMTALVKEQAEAVINGDLSRCEAMLISQAQALQSIFTSMALRASNQEHLPNIETFLKLAFRAQSQCTRTLETLATMKNPPVLFAKQANISHGHQQVNNAPAHPQEITSQSNELLSEINNATLDTGRTATTSGADKAMAAMET